jgi:hypothetical protein
MPAPVGRGGAGWQQSARVQQAGALCMRGWRTWPGPLALGWPASHAGCFGHPPPRGRAPCGPGQRPSRLLQWRCRQPAARRPRRLPPVLPGHPPARRRPRSAAAPARTCAGAGGAVGSSRLLAKKQMRAGSQPAGRVVSSSWRRRRPTWARCCAGRPGSGGWPGAPAAARRSCPAARTARRPAATARHSSARSHSKEPGSEPEQAQGSSPPPADRGAGLQ